jgi:hypothetical protein
VRYGGEGNGVISVFEFRSGMRRNVVDYGMFKERQFWQRMVVSGTR